MYSRNAACHPDCPFLKFWPDFEMRDLHGKRACMHRFIEAIPCGCMSCRHVLNKDPSYEQKTNMAMRCAHRPCSLSVPKMFMTGGVVNTVFSGISTGWQVFAQTNRALLFLFSLFLKIYKNWVSGRTQAHALQNRGSSLPTLTALPTCVGRRICPGNRFRHSCKAWKALESREPSKKTQATPHEGSTRTMTRVRGLSSREPGWKRSLLTAHCRTGTCRAFQDLRGLRVVRQTRGARKGPLGEVLAKPPLKTQ